MAHLDKYTRQELRRILRETYREYDDPTKYENDVDPARTKNNYNFNHDIHGSYDFLNRLDDRVADIIANEMDGKPPRNPPKFASWVITCPKELIGDLNGDDLQIRKFFTEVWNFCCQRYGRENVIDHHGLLLSRQDGSMMTLSSFDRKYESYITFLETKVNGCHKRWYGKTKEHKQLLKEG